MVEEAGVSVGRRVLNWVLKVFGKRGAAAVEGAAAAEGAAAVVEAVEPGAANVLNILKPPLPQGMSNKAFGQLMRWGSGNDAALARIQTLTRTELEQAGVTKEIAKAWADFYRAVKLATPNNPSAAGRASLMDAAAKLLE